MIMEMTNEYAVGKWYESPRTGTSASPAQGSIESSGNSADINSSVAEHMGAFFLDPSGSQRARYYHQSMHAPYGSVASHGKSKLSLIEYYWAAVYLLCLYSSVIVYWLLFCVTSLILSMLHFFSLFAKFSEIQNCDLAKKMLFGFEYIF